VHYTRAVNCNYRYKKDYKIIGVIYTRIIDNKTNKSRIKRMYQHTMFCFLYVTHAQRIANLHFIRTDPVLILLILELVNPPIIKL